MSTLIDAIRGGHRPKFDVDHSNVELRALVTADEIMAAYTDPRDLRFALALILVDHEKQEKSIEMFEYNQKWRKRRP